MNGDLHARTWALIPWLVNGRADAGQRADAEAHLAHCADCRAELDAQRRLQRAIAQDDAPIAGEADAETEAGLQRLLSRLDQLTEQPLPNLPAPAPRRWLPAALAAAVVIQAIGLALLGWRTLDGDDAGYAVLSTPPAAAAAATLRVVPDPTMPLQQWQVLLQQHRLRIADGPNGAGAYALAPLDGAAPAAELLQQLRAAPGVRFAEAITP